MKPLKDYSKNQKSTVIKTVNITEDQNKMIEENKINFSKLVRDLLDIYFQDKTKPNKGEK
jgi:hypothetical protein